MRRIGIVTPDFKHDWASNELLEAVNQFAEGIVIDPISVRISVEDRSSIILGGEPADKYDGFILRALNQAGETDYQYEIFELLANLGWTVVNHPRSLSIAESKAQTTFYLQTAGLPVPRTTVTQNLDDATSAIRQYGTSVLKPLFGSHGIGIEKVEPGVAEEMLKRFLESYGAIYVQEYVPNDGSDIRAFVVGDDIPAAIRRIAPPGHWKTNVYLGADCRPCELTAGLSEICIEAARVIGLDYTGVDVIIGPDGPKILEVNGAPTWHGVLDATARNVAEDVVHHVLGLIDSGRSARQPMDIRFRQHPIQNGKVSPRVWSGNASMPL